MYRQSLRPIYREQFTKKITFNYTVYATGEVTTLFLVSYHVSYQLKHSVTFTDMYFSDLLPSEMRVLVDICKGFLIFKLLMVASPQQLQSRELPTLYGVWLQVSLPQPVILNKKFFTRNNVKVMEHRLQFSAEDHRAVLIYICTRLRNLPD